MRSGPVSTTVNRATARTAMVSAVAGLAVVAAGCSSHHAAPTPASPPGTSTGPSAARALAAIAQVARGASYTATYQAQGESPPRTGTIHAYRTPSSTRLDVDESGSTVRIIVDSTGTYSCKFPKSAAPLCVTLAGAGQQVAAALDPGLQHVFTSSLDTLAAGTGLSVSSAGVRPATAGLGASSCFAVAAVPENSDVSPGTYCFSAGGVLTRAEFRSSVLQLTSVGEVPGADDFALPATPAPLTSASPSQTASPPVSPS